MDTCLPIENVEESRATKTSSHCPSLQCNGNRRENGCVIYTSFYTDIKIHSSHTCFVEKECVALCDCVLWTNNQIIKKRNLSERSHLEELYSGLVPRGDCLIQSCVIMHESREDLVFSVPDLIPSLYVVMILLVQIARNRS